MVLPFNKFQVFMKSEKGQTIVEYALILALITLTVIVILRLMGPAISNFFQDVGTTVDGAT